MVRGKLIKWLNQKYGTFLLPGNVRYVIQEGKPSRAYEFMKCPVCKVRHWVFLPNREWIYPLKCCPGCRKKYDIPNDKQIPDTPAAAYADGIDEGIIIMQSRLDSLADDCIKLLEQVAERDGL